MHHAESFSAQLCPGSEHFLPFFANFDGSLSNISHWLQVGHAGGGWNPVHRVFQHCPAMVGPKQQGVPDYT